MIGLSNETIAAVSTPPGEGAIAIVRLSGPGAVSIADQIFRGKQKPSAAPSRFQQFGEIVEDDRVLDQVMLSVHRAPASYTGEDVVEISCHGGVLVTARVWETCLRAGARAARGGRVYRARFLAWETGSDPGGSGDRPDPRANRSRVAISGGTTGGPARREDFTAARRIDCAGR